MDTLADRTGGIAFYNTNDIFGAVRQAMDDSRFTYQIGYYPEEVDWDGSFHEVQVTVDRPDVKVRVRRGYFALPEPKITKQSVRDAFRFAAASPVDPAEIGIVAHVSVPSAPPTRVLSLAIRFDARAIEFQQEGTNWKATLDAAILQRDRDGKVLTGTEDILQLTLPGDKYQRALREGISLPKDLTVDPNAFDIRVILHDSASGRLGSVTVPLSSYFPPPPLSPAR